MNYVTLYLVIGAIIVALYLRRQARISNTNAAEHKTAIEAGLAEPASLHPVINVAGCIGSGSCVSACPEEALGLVNGKAVLKNGAACIGHGTCAVACPIDAIQLVFGTEKRGMDIPNIDQDFQTNVPGIYIAGELGGMGLIRKAAIQGRQAMDAIRKNLSEHGASGDFDLDVLIVGCGPAGLSAGLSAIQHKLRYRLIEQEPELGGTVYHYPRNKIAMTAPFELALVGKVKFGEVQKEKLLAFWLDVVQRTKLQISFSECMEGVTPDGAGFVVKTSRGSYRARSVLLAMGRRGSPRKLDVPGEEGSPKVVYRLIDAEQYRGQNVLVVGGGDSALEAAIAVSEQPGTTVTLSYRSGAFSRVKAKNRTRVEEQQAAGRLRVVLNSQIKTIGTDTVDLHFDGENERLPNDAVIVCAGGLLPTPLLQSIGIRFDTKFGTA
ncbi:MAG: NAD(P)-binding domain-containing protein [Leptothrix sp. (in: b-proteobacteria)]